jgi:signal transduction histidine kinase
MKTDTFSNQLRWVILLLAAAVILPTVCLLWFMNQAVKNVQLAVRTGLVDIYKKQFELARQNHLNDDWVQLNLCLPSAGGILVYDNDGELAFPVFNDERAIESPVFDPAYAFEYQKKSFDKALEEYRRITEISDSNDIRIVADIAQARCLLRLNRPDKAIDKLHRIVSCYDDENIAIQSQKCNAMLLLAEMTYQSKNQRLGTVLEQLYDFATHGMAADNDLQFIGEADFLRRAIPSETQLFALTRFVHYANQLPPSQKINKKIKRANKLIALITLSLNVAQDYPKPDFVDSPTMVHSAVFRLKTQKPLYGRYRRARDHIRLSVFTQEHFIALLASLLEDVKTLPAACVIYNEIDQRVTRATVPNGQHPFIKMPVSDWLPGWSAHLFVEEVTFENFADKQTAIYLWLAILVIVLILLCGGLATKAVLAQQRMNRLKNDFIATVTHELKTPLASMRVLVDTLLEGNYENARTVPEYLQLVSQENKRLTHLIDSFLTFSRMERNKQVFDFHPASPDEITKTAIEAIQTKLDDGRCAFTWNIEENLPTVNVDTDAMVTVLINLLDNAYKYTNSNKQIELTVYEQDSVICFAVKDNGIGISRRIQKKIFNRFYQVDSRLSRRTEGCGLGLSIVKFIVDAHKGTIELESELNKGSTFRVKLPKA